MRFSGRFAETNRAEVEVVLTELSVSSYSVLCTLVSVDSSSSKYCKARNDLEVQDLMDAPLFESGVVRKNGCLLTAGEKL